MSAGFVAELHRWPVKSLHGEDVEAARFADGGMVGDRAHLLVDGREKRSGSVLTARQNPALLTWASGYGADISDPTTAPTLHDPAGNAWKWDDPELPAALTEALGVPLALRSEPGNQDRGRTVLVTLQSTLDALGDELGGGIDLRRFRPNLHLDLDVEPFAELDWAPGTTLTAGGVSFEIVGSGSGACVRCAVPSWDPSGQRRWKELQTWLIEQHDNKFGTIMRATTSGTVRRGAEVAVVRPASR